MKLLRTIRLDASDTFIFRRAAEPGEWAISGAFVFAGADLPALEGKELAAFRGGFLGVPSVGWSTLAQVVDADAGDLSTAIDLVARCLLEHFGAPDTAMARQAAAEEIDFAASLCEHPAGTLIALRRRDENGAIREVFRSLKPHPGAERGHVFSIVDAPGQDEPDDSVDLIGLARGDGR